MIQINEEKDDVLLSLVPQDRLEILMKALLAEREFLSPYGIRSLSKIHEDPYEIQLDGQHFQVDYEPGESTTTLFGGNSNWRGPIWFPVNYLCVHSLATYHEYYGPDLKFECPVGSGNFMTLQQLSAEISKRLVGIFRKDENGERPVNGLHKDWYKDEYFKDLILFYEHFHGDNGRGLGASHQTGWTGLVANLIDESY